MSRLARLLCLKTDSDGPQAVTHKCFQASARSSVPNEIKRSARRKWRHRRLASIPSYSLPTAHRDK
jgi:hypothetical protein